MVSSIDGPGSPSTHSRTLSRSKAQQRREYRLESQAYCQKCTFIKTLFNSIPKLGQVFFPNILEQASGELSGIGRSSRAPIPGIMNLSSAIVCLWLNKNIVVSSIQAQFVAWFTCGVGCERSHYRRTIRSATTVSQSSSTRGSEHPWENI